MKSLAVITALTCLAALLVTPADALEYRIDAPQDYLFGQDTSDATIYEWENPNVDRSKNTALIAPGFGMPTSYLPNSGELLTLNLAAGVLGRAFCMKLLVSNSVFSNIFHKFYCAFITGMRDIKAGALQKRSSFQSQPCTHSALSGNRYLSLF